jgi:uncharacterized delta-60 repeat protein
VVVCSRSSGGEVRSAARRCGHSIALLALLLGLLALPSAAQAVGAFDQTFDGDGRVVTDFGVFDQGSDVAIQADGKIVAAGSSGADFALARYNPDGSLDPTFDGDGRVVTDFGAFDQGSDVAIQADGKIVAAGSSGADFALARYKPDGSLDPTFDGDGRVVTDFGADDGANGVAVQADGTIVAAGQSSAGVLADLDFALARYNPDGSLDPTFDGDGRVVTDFGGAFNDQANAVAIQTDGKIVAAGLGETGLADLDFALARYNPDGSLDPTLDSDGRVMTGFAGPRGFGANDLAHGVAIQADGKIVAAGGSDTTFGTTGANPRNFVLVRYNPDGSLDPTFDGDGRAVTDFGADDFASGIAIQADGKIIAAGLSGAGANPHNFALARYNANGSLNPAFGTVVTDFGADDFASGIAIQADGKIVAAGSSGGDFALARYKKRGKGP